MQNTNRVYIAAVAGLFFAFAPSVCAQVPVRALQNGLKAAQRTGAELVSPWTKVKISLPTQSMQHIPPSKSQPNAPFAQRVALRFPAASLQYYRATRGMSREQALREVARLRVESAVSEARGTHAWPQVIKEGAITVPDFNGLTLDGFMGRLGTPRSPPAKYTFTAAWDSKKQACETSLKTAFARRIRVLCQTK